MSEAAVYMTAYTGKPALRRRDRRSGMNRFKMPGGLPNDRAYATIGGGIVVHLGTPLCAGTRSD